MPNGYAHVEKMTEDLTEKRMELVDDLLREILLRLPAESLLRFKCVSKHWHSIISSAISDPKFCSNHTRINQKLSMFGAYYYFHRWELQERVRSVSFPKINRTLPTLTFLNQACNSEPAIVHAFKGLFVCWFGDENPLVVCNLTTQKFTKLPQHLPFIPSEYHDAPAAFLHFDPKKSLHYKVVIVSWCYNDEDVIKYYRDEETEEDYSEHDGIFYRIDIYSSESKTWKRKHFPEIHTRWGSDSIHVALWNGAIHWETSQEIHTRFEIDTETLISSPIPRPIVTEQHLIRYFGECCGRLFLIQIERPNCKGFNILEMDNDFCWNLKYRVDMMPIRTNFDEIFTNPDPMGYSFYREELISWEFCVIGMVNEEKSDDLALLLGLPGNIISYDLKTGTFKVIQEFPESEFCLYYYNLAVAFHFIPTLSPT